jgi:hypothetical protein
LKSEKLKTVHFALLQVLCDQNGARREIRRLKRKVREFEDQIIALTNQMNVLQNEEKAPAPADE